MKTVYTSLYDITEIQQKIVRYIDHWVHIEKTPIPQTEIVKEMQKTNESVRTVVHAITGLIKLGYIRKAVINGQSVHSKIKYVQLRRL